MTTFAFRTRRGNRDYTDQACTIDKLVSLYSAYLFDGEDGSLVDSAGHVVMDSYKVGQKTGVMDFDGEYDRYDVKDGDDLDEDDWYLLERAYEKGMVSDPGQRDFVKNHIEEENGQWN